MSSTGIGRRVNAPRAAVYQAPAKSSFLACHYQSPSIRGRPIGHPPNWKGSSFLDGWLQPRKEEGRKQIEQSEWEYCQDPSYAKLKTILSQVVTWRHVMGRLSHTNSLLTSSGETSRMKVILSTGLQTPTGVITERSHDTSRADYIYESVNAGDGTVEDVRVLDDLEATSPTIE